jgi:glycosyltransferase involved in cell wall biosynthesis
MRILLIRYGLYPPELHAGTELTLHWLCKSLIARAHKVGVAACTATPQAPGGAIDHVCGYPVARSPNLNNAVYSGINRFRADVVVVVESGAWMDSLLPAVSEYPLVIYEHQVSLDPNDVPEIFRSHAVFIANSPATAANLSQNCGITSHAVVRPLFGIEKYAGIRRHGNAVLFVSLQERKGADVAIAIAERRPAAKFLFVESWRQWPDRTEILREHVRKIPNITLVPNQDGLTQIMPEIKLLLMPSRSQEAWGRTATEAQLCGIPVLGSSRGNLPVTIGPGGVTLDPDEPIERWLAAFDRMMEDSVYYDALSQAALAHGRKLLPEVERAYYAFEQALHHAIQARRA